MFGAFHGITPFLLLLGSQQLLVSAQTSSGSFQFPVEDKLTINFIDTIVLQWTSNYLEAYLLMWCQNGTAGNNVVLGSSFQVQPIGNYPYILSKNDPSQSAFPVACHAEILPTPGGVGFDSPFGITFTSSPGIQAKTLSLVPSSGSSQPPSTTSTSTISATNSPSSITTSTSTTSKPSPNGNNSPQSSSSTTSTGTSSSTTVPAAGATSSTNTGAIVGGVIGGLGVLCIIAFGILILRRLKRKDVDLDSKPKRASSWWRFQNMTPVQIHGLHEKDATSTRRYEKDGNQRFEKEGDLPRRAPVVELPAETII